MRKTHDNRRKHSLACLVLFALVFAGCAPTSPALLTPTASATAPATINFRATEALIIAHMFATMTASAPRATATSTPVPPPTARPSSTPRPKAPTLPPSTPVAKPPVPKATTDVYLEQIPKGMGGILVVNYVGNRDVNYTLDGLPMVSVKSGEKRLVVIAAGQYSYSVQIPGESGASWSDVITVVAGTYKTFPVYLPQ